MFMFLMLQIVLGQQARRINAASCVCVYKRDRLYESWHAVQSLDSPLKEFVTELTVYHLWQKTAGAAAVFLLFLR